MALLGLIWVCWPSAAVAEHRSTEHSESIEEVLVIGQLPEALPLGIRRWNQQDLAKGFNNLSDFLERQNGLQLQSLGGIGDPVLVSIRGASAQQTRILVNGVPVAQAQYGSYDLNALPVNQIERIEILDSSADSQSGLSDDAIGGTINIVTRTSVEEFQASLSAGSWGTWLSRLDVPLNAFPALSQLNSPIQAALLIEHQRSENDYDYPVPSPYANPTQRHQIESLRNSAYRKDSLLLSLNASHAFHASLGYKDEFKEVPDFFRNSPNNQASNASKQTSIRLSGRIAPDDILNHQWQLTHDLTREAYLDPNATLGQYENDDQNRYQTSTASWSSELSGLAPWLFRLTLAADEQTFSSRHRTELGQTPCSNLSNPCDLYGWRRHIKGGAQAHWLGAQSTSPAQLSGGLSAHHHRYQSLSRPQGESATSVNQDRFLEQQNRYASWLVFSRLEWTLDGFSAWWKLSAKRAVRLPSLYEQFGDHGLLQGNSELQPEVGKTLSLDSRYQFALLGRQQDIRLNLFERQLDQVIVAIYDTTGVGQYNNVGESVLNGAEWQWVSQLISSSFRAAQDTDRGVANRHAHHKFELTLSGSHYHSNTQSVIKSSNNNQLPGIYHTRILAGLNWSSTFDGQYLDRQSTELTWELADDLYLDSANLVEGDTRRQLNLSQRWEWSGSAYSAHTGIRITNLTNHRFNDFSNRPTAGRRWTLFADFNF